MHRLNDDVNHSVLLKAPRVAWGTVLLFTGLLAAWSGGMAAGLCGGLSTPAAVALSTAGAFAAFTVMHDASHHAVSRLRWLNSLLGHASASILLVRFVGFQNVHRRHHRFAGDPLRDPDRYSGEGPWWQLPLRWATADLHYFFEYEPRDGISRRDNLESWLSALVLVAAIAGFLLTGHAIDFLVHWLLPARIALFLLTYSFDYVPHQRPHCRATSESPYRASFIIEGRLATVLLLCQNYHLVHHLYPGVPFYRCARIWRARREELLARGARLVSLFELPRPPGAKPPVSTPHGRTEASSP
ncbi:fatty acid desaturase [Archangium violaceum]|uniref:fatty acid desaturase n=1 Tax=Archangium violaceum TaxID=83451 RepID=UPI00193C0B4F|nr:fatty acid desaturase [Archangium violaceum]QRK10604.1 fatty acid desaturase [Archangium violaceum]